ncbi:MAG: AAA family ATPase [Thermodesulfobacteriota bacterium]
MTTFLVFMGMIASGKSYLAESLAAEHGYDYFNSDRVRKELAGIDPTTSCKDEASQGIYTAQWSRRTYDRLIELAREHAGPDGSRFILLDGSYQARGERERLLAALADFGRVVFILCSCPEEVMRERMDKRAADPQAVSDGRWEIYLKQKEAFEPPAELGPNQLIELNTDADLDVLKSHLDERLEKAGLPKMRDGVFNGG